MFYIACLLHNFIVTHILFSRSLLISYMLLQERLSLYFTLLYKTCSYLPRLILLRYSVDIYCLVLYILRMSTIEVKNQHDAWVVALSTGTEPSVCDLVNVIFDLSFSKVRLDAMLVGIDHEDKLKEKKAT